MELSAAPSVMRKPGAESAIMGSVTTSSATYSQALRSVKRPDPVAVGTIVWLGSEVMFFAGLFAMYFTHRSVMPAQEWAENSAHLAIPFAIANTTVLVLSSVTCQFGVIAAERFQPERSGRLFQITRWGMNEWFVLTFILGSIFVAGQVFEYAELTMHGVTLYSNAYGSAFYMTTGFHAIHVTGGLIAFLLIIGRTFTTRTYSHRQATGAIVTSYYWHFVDVVWIALWATIYLLR